MRRKFVATSWIEYLSVALWNCTWRTSLLTYCGNCWCTYLPYICTLCKRPLRLKSSLLDFMSKMWTLIPSTAPVAACSPLKVGAWNCWHSWFYHKPLELNLVADAAGVRTWSMFCPETAIRSNALLQQQPTSHKVAAAPTTWHAATPCYHRQRGRKSCWCDRIRKIYWIELRFTGTTSFNVRM